MDKEHVLEQEDWSSYIVIIEAFKPENAENLRWWTN